MDDIPDQDMKQLDQKLIQAFKAIGNQNMYKCFMLSLFHIFFCDLISLKWLGVARFEFE